MRNIPRTVLAVTLFAAGCGGGGGNSAQPTGPTASAPSPVPTAAPTPTPTPCTVGLCEAPVTNTAAPEKVTLRLYWVSRPNSNDLVVCHEGDTIPVGYNFAVDLNAKDKDNKPTNGTGNIYYRYDGTDQLVSVHVSNPYQPRFTIESAGNFQIQGVLDEVRSDWLHLTFTDNPAKANCK